MGGKAKAPPPPDYSELAAVSREAAEISAQVAREQLDWAREQDFMNREVAELVIEDSLERQEMNDLFALQDRDRYERIFQPLEDQLARDAEDAASPWKMEEAAGLAQADVSQQFAIARDAAQQRLESFGIDPSQTRAAALDRATGVQEAAARASAGNQARRQQEAVGRALRSEAINVGRGYPGQIVNSFGVATNSGNQAVNTGLATTQVGGQTMGNPATWQGNSIAAINGWWNGTNDMYRNQIAAFDAQNRANAGAMQLPGMILGGALRLATGGIGGADGGAVPSPGEIEAQVGPNHDGTPVSRELSPSRGAVVDDVPARLNAGEFIIPEDAVRWYGEKTFHQMVAKADKERQAIPLESGAEPEMMMLPANERPAINTALPME